MSIAKSKVFEVGVAVKIVARAIGQLSRTSKSVTEKIAVNEFSKALDARKEEK